MQLLFKKCASSDLDKLVEISRKTFVDAFEKDNDPKDFNNYVNKTFEKSNIEQQLQNPDSIFCFVYKDKVLAGYLKVNENDAQTDLKSSKTMELERIYVLQDFQGRQIGKHILQEALAIASRKGKDFLWLGVWEKNVDAIRFYTKCGFVKFGTHPYYIGKDRQTDWLMRYDLSNFQVD